MRSLFLALFVVGLSACTHVRPYERETLSRPIMDTDRERYETAFRSHVYDAREGAMGGYNSTGGGCGCN